MASPFGGSKWLWNEAEELVNISFNRFIDEVNRRREFVLSSLKDIREEIPTHMSSIKQIECQIGKIENGMTLNFIHDTREKTINDLKHQISEIHLQACCAEYDYQFVFDDTEMKRALSTLGAFEKYPIHYSEKEFAKSGFEYELKHTGKFSVKEELGLIALNNGNEKRINYFDLANGKCLSSFKLDSYPKVVAIELINKQEIALSTFQSKSIMTMQFNPRDKIQAQLLSETKGKLETITSLCYDKQSNHIYAVSSTKHCLNILDRKLALLKVVSLPCMFPQYIHVKEEEIYILDCSNPCIHILTRNTHDIIRSIIPRGSDLRLNKPSCFAVDRDRNIIIPIRNWINIFSPSGQLLRSFPVNQNLDSISQPFGVSVTDNYEIILLTDASRFPIQIF